MLHESEEGYLVARGMFAPEETERYRSHYMALRAQGPHPHDFAGVDANEADPLSRFPRMRHMHRWDPVSLEFLLDQRIRRFLETSLGSTPLAVQSMIYFKPPGARGQSMHQDKHYIRASPGICIAAWLALDDTDEENGCLQVVPGSGALPLLPITKADTTTSFIDVGVAVPNGLNVKPVLMAAGDVLFFNGSLIHGSLPNRSETRFRRTLIGHYITGDARGVGPDYHPVLHMDGRVAELDVT